MNFSWNNYIAFNYIWILFTRFLHKRFMTLCCVLGSSRVRDRISIEIRSKMMEPRFLYCYLAVPYTVKNYLFPGTEVLLSALEYPNIQTYFADITGSSVSILRFTNCWFAWSRERAIYKVMYFLENLDILSILIAHCLHHCDYLKKRWGYQPNLLALQNTSRAIV